MPEKPKLKDYKGFVSRIAMAALKRSLER